MRLLIHRGEASSPARNNFDVIRLAMALLVVWSHSFALHLGSEDSEPVNRLMGGHYTGGTVAVMVFFIISGFLITQSFDRSKTVGSYLIKRVRRIYPGYMVATTICAFIVVPLFSTHADLGPIRAAKVIGHNLLLQGFVPPSNAFAGNPNHDVNGSLWTIPFEFGCYLGVILIGAKRRGFLVALLIATLLGRLGLEMFVAEPWRGPTHWPFLWLAFVPSFTAGMISYSYRDVLPRSRTLLIALAALAVLACRVNGPVANLIVVPALAYATFYIAFSDRLPLHDAARYGDFSYGTYLYAFPIQQMLQAAVVLTFASYIAASLALSLLAGIASWHIVEKRFLRRKLELPVPVSVGATQVASA